MSESSTTINATIEPELKKETEEIFENLGLTFSEAIQLFLAEVSLHKGFPFEINIPNKETRKALVESENREAMEHFHTVDDLFDDLGIS